ncbi:MAG TPA: hypothetical protein PLF61_02040 [Candidatus Goldiibacteriota bacterium]|nr:hypothetical protein [Candidatus Goldiibacteriota bacterium]
MKNNSKILTEIKERIEKFAIEISKGLTRPRKKFLRQMIYGIQAGRDIKISEISRNLCKKIKLIKTEIRLTHQLAREDLTDKLNMRLLEKGVRRIKEDTVHALDLSDIRKDFAKKMENMDRVYDGSRKEIVWILDMRSHRGGSKRRRVDAIIQRGVFTKCGRF